MGMAASQARLLSITARLSDNEQSGQQLSYAKERLADRSDQVTKEYNEALSATKLQIMTGYADGAAHYTDISFAMLTSPQVVSNLGKQYCVTDTQGRVLVTPQVAKAYQSAKGSLNAFLGALGYSISDVDPTKKAGTTPDPAIEEKIHEAWDKYFNSIGKKFTQDVEVDGVITTVESHAWDFEYVEKAGSGIGEGYVSMLATFPEDGTGTTSTFKQTLNYEGTNQEQLDLYNYAMAITESYYSASHDFEAVENAFDQGNSSMISYYTNLYNKMLSSGYYSYTNTLAEAKGDPEHWLYDNDLYKGVQAGNISTSEFAGINGTPLDDPNTFEQYLKSGKLLLESFSKPANKFVSTSISEDTCIQEVEDDTRIAQAEAKYEDDLKQIQRLDSRYDLQMKQLDTEHNTLQTEYDSVKNIITKNVEKSFQTFG